MKKKTVVGEIILAEKGTLKLQMGDKTHIVSPNGPIEELIANQENWSLSRMDAFPPPPGRFDL